MDRIVFKKQIDRIYEKLYSINESLSSEDSNELIRGFNDGIKEGYELFNENINNLNEWNPFKAVAKAAGAVTGAIGGAAKGVYNQGVKAAGAVGNAISGAYQQGKELATKVWASATEFATGVIKKVSDAINTAASWIADQPGKIKEYLTGIYNDVVADMKSAYESLKDKAQELATSIQNIWNTITTNVKNVIASAKAKILTTEEAAKQWYEKNKQIVITQAQELQASSIAWMKEAGKTTLDVLTQIGNGAVTALKGVGICVVILMIGPFVLLYKGIQQIPELYAASKQQVEAGISQIGKYWEEAGQEFNSAKDANFNKGLAATTPTGKVLQRDPVTGQMLPYKENKIFKFSDFVTEKKRKEEFFKKLK